MKRRHLIAVASALVLSGALISPAQSYNFTLPSTPSYGYTIEETLPNYGDSISQIMGITVPMKSNNFKGENRLCSSIEDSHCEGVTDLNAKLILPPCAADSDRTCIESLELGTKDNMVKASLDHVAATPGTPASTKFGLPAGGGMSLWKSTNVKTTDGTNTFGVGVQVQYYQQRSSGSQREVVFKASEYGNVILQGFRAVVMPINMMSGNFSLLENYETKDANLDGHFNTGTRFKDPNYDNVGDCAWTETKLCAKYSDFVPGTRVALTLRLGNDVTGWLFGRMQRIDVSLKTLDSKFNVIRIEGDSVDIPSASGFILKSDLPKYPAIDKIARSNYYEGDGFYEKFIASPFSSANGGQPSGGFDSFLAWEPFLKPTELRNSRWVISGGANSNGYVAGLNNACTSDKTKLNGVVTTNAMIYEPGPPTFTGDSLSYKVAGLHSLADGSTFSGTYDLSMRKTVAQCLYKFSDAPLKAVVAVTSQDGSSQDITTEALSEKDGWLHLGAYNFHFSQPTIRIKLTQEKSATIATPTPATPAPTTSTPSVGSAPAKSAPGNQTAPKSTSITCVKGKTVKKVTAAKPVCPAGYKKK